MVHCRRDIWAKFVRGRLPEKELGIGFFSGPVPENNSGKRYFRGSLPEVHLGRVPDGKHILNHKVYNIDNILLK